MRNYDENHMHGSCLSDAPRLLVIRSGAIGDTIVMSVVYQALRRHFPRAYLEVIGPIERLGLINTPGMLDVITSIDNPDIATLFSEALPLSDTVISHLRQFDRILIYSFDRSGELMSRLRNIRPFGVFRFDPFPNHESSEHVTHYLLRTLRVLGIDAQAEMDITPRVVIDREAVVEPKTGPLRVAIHPGSGSSSKNWPIEHFVELCLRLVQAFSLNISLVVGPAEQTLLQKISCNLFSISPLKILAQLPLPELARELQSCALYIGNDSGISHLAAALNIPTIAIFRTSNPAIWRPVGKYVLVFHEPSADQIYNAAAEYVYNIQDLRDTPLNPLTSMGFSP
ncbi:MAG: glycosyltransferase family 9 protein [Candidatus Vecturithrix sp.]|jgi:ADP-heptose:LPS heptosyltransferase|nr:glycosyltransferase family 9 protein [Candidatus Vecturithrix sp.]